MIVQRTPKLSPLAGEGAERRRREAGEGGLVLRARSLRSSMIDAERKLWLALRDRRFAAFKFRRQVPIGRFIADFMCYSARVIVEVDGSQPLGSVNDSLRDRWLAENNFIVLRYWNNEVLQDLEGVLTSIHTSLTKQTPHPSRASRGHPSPARGEGKREIAR